MGEQATRGHGGDEARLKCAVIANWLAREAISANWDCHVVLVNLGAPRNDRRLLWNFEF